MKKRAMTVLIAVTLVGCSDNKSAIGRYQVHESSVDEYFGTKSDSMLTSKLSHVLIKTDTTTGESWYWDSRYMDGKQTTNEWVPIKVDNPLGLNLGHK
jgi:hypothetical protein